jgi:putative peptide zinc metalloprotease protein
MLVFLALMVLWTLPRLDEFFHTFNQFFSLEGIAATLITLGFVKIVHEFAHAFTAIRYGVKVPHMGVAFIVMYPVLYTETTGSWQLSSRRARFHIAIAGVTAELCLAAIFLALWHVFPAGSLGQSACFLVVCVSLVGSLLVNLNPLMRFDGYYMLSDATGFDNLQSRSIAFARYHLREILFGLQESPPEKLAARDAHFLTIFGAALLVYRFFLFAGIAVLVYHVFFQPLGFFLMLVEILWFILIPLWSELKIWWTKRTQIKQSRRSLVPAIVVGAALLFALIPWKTSVLLPAVAHAGEYRRFYAPAPSEILMVQVKDGQLVKEGDILAVLQSPDLEFKLRVAQHALDTLETLRRRVQSDPVAILDPALSDAAIEKARLTVVTLEDQKKRLTMTAPFNGVVRDLNMELQEGRYIRTDEPMFVLIDPDSGTVVTAYATEDESEKMNADAKAEFVSADRSIHLKGLALSVISSTGQSAIDWPELSSLFGGPVAADRSEAGEIVPRRSLYMVQTGAMAETLPMARTGYLRVDSTPDSIFIIFIKWLGGLARQEAHLG